MFGRRSTHEQFRRLHHMPYARTLVGAGPRGETLVFEVDKQDEGLADWLQREFAVRGDG